MKNDCGQSVGFPFRAALWFRRPVILFTRSFLRSRLKNLRSVVLNVNLKIVKLTLLL